MEFTAAPFVDEKLLRFDPLLLKYGWEDGIDLATDSQGVFVAFNQRELDLTFRPFVLDTAGISLISAIDIQFLECSEICQVAQGGQCRQSFSLRSGAVHLRAAR